MKQTFYAILFAFLLSGCCSAELQRQAQFSEARAYRFVDLIESAQTTRQQEQDFIRACAVMFTAIRAASGAESIVEPPMGPTPGGE